MDLLAGVTGTAPALVTTAPEAPGWRPGLEIVPDLISGGGALGGIHAAVSRAAPDLVLCVAWDMPFLTAALLTALVEGAAGFDAFLPESGGPRGVEPLCAVYGPACAAAIAKCHAAGDDRAIAFHDEVRVGTLSLARVRQLGDPARLFFNVNTPADLERAQRP